MQKTGQSKGWKDFSLLLFQDDLLARKLVGTVEHAKNLLPFCDRNTLLLIHFLEDDDEFPVAYLGFCRQSHSLVFDVVVEFL